ncbi:glycosyltransferase family 4 protein [Leptolyngbya sp. ST-U4]|uniref:glycosyltransferase family 4 protein n=1 Tax=Leptolyngbya sp. ST-U4 TaxID=2933912 RepID=UPI0019B5F3F9|nr:glycosyltransferase family 4 protein [Cyanobacteria bacterium FACHB-502]
MTPRRLRILFLASYFPKPDNPLMGTWALTQAQAIARQDVELQVVSFTSWVPSFLAKTPGAKAYANCPDRHTWEDGVQAYYPRWLYYPISPLKQWAYKNPIPYQRIAAQSALSKLCRTIGSFQPDVIFCHHSLPNGWLVTQLPPQFRKPLIVQEHDFDEIADCHRYPQRKAAMKQVVDRAWAILTVSRRMEKDLVTLFPQGNVQTCHNGVHLPASQLWRTPRPDFLKEKTIILACALFAERKGIPVLIEAFDRVAAQHPNAILRIIGFGPAEELVKATIAQSTHRDAIQLVGKQPHSEVLQEMVWADCFALVGWDEPFATVYLEAMAAGTSIIYCNDGGISDVVQEGVHGFTVPPKSVTATAEAIDRMLSNPAQRVQMGKNAQRLIQQHLTWDVKAKELIQLIETAVSSSKQLAHQS